ncbi:MAG: hypothetical protein K9J76_10230 [Polaromonas sp.]|nr:hypothetical protein [Polaromonas sp.]
MNKLKPPPRMPSDQSRGRIWLVLAGVSTGLFMLNVVSRMLFTKQGIALWRLNDVGEFLLVLVAMAFFVVGILAAEKQP